HLENPDAPQVQSRLANFLATCPEAKYRDAGRAVELAKKAVDQAPGSRLYWANLGLAHYRAGDWKAAITALEKALKLKDEPTPVTSADAPFLTPGATGFVLAMAHWKAGNKGDARGWYNAAVQWMDRFLANNEQLQEQLRRFRAEA